MNRVQVFGNGDAEVKIYPIKRKAPRSKFYQIAWYELGDRRTKTFVDPLKAKSFAQQVQVSLLNKGRSVEVTPQDIQMLRDAESMVAKFGVSSALDEADSVHLHRPRVEVGLRWLKTKHPVGCLRRLFHVQLGFRFCSGVGSTS